MKSLNQERFPDNIFEPYTIRYADEKYTVYTMLFKNLYDLYKYLKAKPVVNITAFPGELSSIEGSFEFAGEPYDDAVEMLVGEIDPGYEEFLKIEGMVNAGLRTHHKYETIKTVAGGHVNVPLYTAGSPVIYQASRIMKAPKFVNFNVALAYLCNTNKKQVFNRAIIITNLMKALEQAGYNVDINAFSLASEYDEIIHIVLEIKKHGDRMDYEALYKSLCRVEFFRRLCFRLFETSDVRHSSWHNGYGRTCDKRMTRSVLSLNKNDLFFPQPNEMGIHGNDLEEDFVRAIDFLKIGNLLDVESLKDDFSEKVKLLKL